MTPTERAEFLEARSYGIGGSDAASLLQPYLSEVKYGCRRRLWFQKSRIAPDYPQDDSFPMRLGRLLEPFFADLHTEHTGAILTTPKLLKHPVHPELLVNIDRTVKIPSREDLGTGEIKSLGPDMYWKTKRDGIIVDYELQVEHSMLVSGLKWGRFIVGNRAYGGYPLYWDIEANKDIQEAILAEGPAFWKTLGNEALAPDRLEPDDKRCGTCQWRKTCQGNALIHVEKGQDLPYAEDLRPLLLQYDEVNAKFCEKLPDGTRGTADDLRLAEVKEELRAALAARDAVAVSWPGEKDRKVYNRKQDGRVTWKTDDLVRIYERMRKQLRLAPLDPDQFDIDFPPAETFKREGIPFNVLRIY